MKKCTRCVLPENYPGIEFDEAGVCNYCRTQKKWGYKGKEELDKFLGSFRGKGEKYDCLVGISGGRDSSYMLYYLVKVCRLRVIAYTSDNGFIPEIVKIDMKNMTEILNVELVTEKHDLLKRCIKHNVSSWLRSPSPAMIPMICCGCKLGGSRGMLVYARKNKIPLIAQGVETPVETGTLKRAFFAANPLGKRFGRNKTFSMLSGLLYEMFRNPRYLLSPFNTLVYVAEYLYFFQFKNSQRLFYPGQEILDLYRYIEWNEDRILSTIQTELNWSKGDSLSSWRFDCQVSFLKNHLFLESVGFTEKDDCMCNMIREDMITREEAMERLKTENTIPRKLVTDLLDEIGLRDKEKLIYPND